MRRAKKHNIGTRWTILAIVCLLNLSQAYSQTPRIKRLLRLGAKSYTDKDYDKATRAFTDATHQDSTSAYANYGIGNTLYMQGKYQEAMPYYQRTLEQNTQLPAQQQAQVLHNLGNIAMKGKQYDAAIEFYQQSLILNPSDDETRYNLVLAQKLKKQDDKQDQQDKNEDKQEQQQQQQNKPQEQPNNTPPKSQEQQPEKQDGAMTPQQAEQILNAFKQNDERTRKRVEQAQRNQQAERNNQVKHKW